MASTFISYNGRDVQVPESAVTIVGYILFHEAYVAAATPDDRLRFERMARDFGVRTTGVGCTDLGLDELLRGDASKEQEFLSFLNLARARLASFGEEIPAEYLDTFMPIPEYRGRALASPWFHTILDVIEALIRGEPTPKTY